MLDYEPAVSFAKVQAWLEKVDFTEDLHPRDEMGRFITSAANITRGEKAMDEVIRNKGSIARAMHRSGVGHIAFHYGDKKHGVAHILDRHGEAAARKMPSVIGSGTITRFTTAGGRQRVHIEHEGHRAVLSPDYHGTPGHWLVTGFERGGAKKSAPGAAGDPHKDRSGLLPSDRFGGEPGGAGATTTIHPGGGSMPAAKFSAIHKDMTVSSVHTATALGNQDDKDGKKPAISVAYLQKRNLHPHDAETAKSPFLYDVNALGSLRPDQVPRFFGALTDSDKLPDAEVPMDSLVAMQDRVDPGKVEAIRSNGAGGKKAVVVRHNGKHYIADGHHRLTADWLNGADTAQVKLKDLEEHSNALKRETQIAVRVCKVDDSLGMVFGFAIVCKIKGEDYYDLNVDQDGPHAGKRVPEHIPEDVMAKAAAAFMESERAGNEMHDGPDIGKYIFAFPLTTDIAKAMGITTEKTGLMVGYKAPEAVLQKFRDGTYTGFSIEGKRLNWTEHE